MSVSILIISHEEIGTALINTIKSTLGYQLPIPVATVELQPDADPEVLIPKLRKVLTALDQGDGVLILTDLFGATPSNIANELQKNNRICVVTGLNLPMLLRVMNYPQLSLDELAEKALTGGHDGIIECMRAHQKQNTKDNEA